MAVPTATASKKKRFVPGAPTSLVSGRTYSSPTSSTTPASELAAVHWYPVLGFDSNAITKRSPTDAAIVVSDAPYVGQSPHFVAVSFVLVVVELVALSSPPPHATSRNSRRAHERDEGQPGAHQTSRAMLANFVYVSRNASRVTPVGPFRCFDTITSAVPR